VQARPLQTRSDLIALVARHAPSKACARAISEGRATVLGGFAAPKHLPCFIVRVTSKHDREWLIAVDVDEAAYRFRVRSVEAVPWQHWDGRSDGKRPLIDGDRPREMAYERMKARRRCRRST
jgi:hypothetical protein